MKNFDAFDEYRHPVRHVNEVLLTAGHHCRADVFPSRKAGIMVVAIFGDDAYIREFFDVINEDIAKSSGTWRTPGYICLVRHMPDLGIKTA